MIVSPEILGSIEAQRIEIERDRDYSDIGKIVKKVLQEEALVHSGLIEAGHTRKELREKKKKALETQKSLTEAWVYAMTSHKYGEKQITPRFILEVASRINGELTGYRHENVRVTGQDAVMPPGADDVERHLEALLSQVNGDGLHPVEKAGLLHLHFARIHPLPDGNGRAARLLQNIVLDSEGYAPAIINSSERGFYQGILRCAMRGYLEREAENGFNQVWQPPLLDVSRKETGFFDYIASKVGVSLESQMNRVDCLPEYIITLPKAREPGQVITVKRILDAYFRAGNKVGQVRVPDIHNTLRVRGDICFEALSNLLVKTEAAHPFTIVASKK